MTSNNNFSPSATPIKYFHLSSEQNLSDVEVYSAQMFQNLLDRKDELGEEIVVLQPYSCSWKDLRLDLRYLAYCFSVLTNNPPCFLEIFLAYVVFQWANLFSNMYRCWLLVLKVFYYWATLALWSPWHLVADHTELWRKLLLIWATFAPWCCALRYLTPGWVLVFSWLRRVVSWGVKTKYVLMEPSKIFKESQK